MVVVAVVVAVAWVAGASVLGWWATDGSWFPAILLGSFTALVAFGLMVPLALTWADAGSVRQAKRSLRAAKEGGHLLAAARAHLRLRVLRWQRKSR